MNASAEFIAALQEGGPPESDRETKVLGLPPLPELIDRIQHATKLHAHLKFAGAVDTSKLSVEGSRALSLASELGVRPSQRGNGISMRLRGYNPLVGPSSAPEAYFYVKGPRTVENGGAGPRLKVRDELRRRLPHADISMGEQFLAQKYGLSVDVSLGTVRLPGPPYEPPEWFSALKF